jgi:hypothetical protein
MSAGFQVNTYWGGTFPEEYIFAMSDSFRVILLKVQHFIEKLSVLEYSFQIRLLFWGAKKLKNFL